MSVNGKVWGLTKKNGFVLLKILMTYKIQFDTITIQRHSKNSFIKKPASHSNTVLKTAKTRDNHPEES